MDIDDLETAAPPPPDPDRTATAPPRAQGSTVPRPPVSRSEADVAEPLPQLPGYAIEGTLGRGAMGVVYRARDTRLKRAVALKMILAGPHAGVDEVRRFQQEAEAIARIQHPNIVQIFEIGAHGGLPYCALELAEGGSLAGQLRGEPKTAGEAARITRTLARALHEAHGRDVVHRDLKPANVLVTADGELKVTDFGLAKRLDVDDGRSRTGQIMGTPSYMAPEQAAGRVNEIGPAADVYALGAMLYEMLTGRPPFRGTSVLDTLEQVRRREPLAPSKLQPDVPRDLETIALKCLEKEPARRYASARALAEDLERFLAGEPILARPVSDVERAWKWARRNPGIAGLSAALVLAVLGGLAGVFVQWQQAVAARDEAERARDSALAEKKRAEREQRNAEGALYAQEIGLAENEWRANRLARAREVLAECPPAWRHWEWSYLAARCRPERAAFAASAPIVSALALSPDGKRLAIGSYARQALGMAVDVSIAGLRMKAGRVGLEIADVDGGAPRMVPDVPDDEVTALAFSPDGRVLASAASDGSVGLRDATSGAPLSPITTDGGPLFAVAFSGDSRFVASGGGVGVPGNFAMPSFPGVEKVSGTLRVRAVPPSAAASAPARVVYALDAKARRFTSVLLNADGTRLAYVCQKVTPELAMEGFGMAGRSLSLGQPPPPEDPGPKTGLAVVELPSGKELWRKDELVELLAWSGDRIAYTQGNALYTVDANDGNDLSADQPTLAMRPLAVRGAGDALAAVGVDGEGLVRTWDGQAGPVRGPEYPGQSPEEPAARRHLGAGRTLRGHAGAVRCAAVAVRAAVAASGGENAQVLVWDLSAESPRQASKVPDAIFGVSASVGLDPGWTRIAVGSEKSLEVRSLSTGEVLRAWPGLEHGMHAVALSASGARVAGGSWDHLAHVWDVASGKQLGEYAGGPGGVALSPDGKLLAMGTPLHPGPFVPPSFSETDNRTLRVFDVDSGQELANGFVHDAMLRRVAYSPDGRWLATGADDGLVALWTARPKPDSKLEPLALLKGHAGKIVALAFSPDGRRLFSADETVVRVWDVEVKRLMLEVPHPGEKRLVALRAGDDRRTLELLDATDVVTWKGAAPDAKF